MKKIVSFLLALVMILNLGITAFAEGTYTISLTTEDDTADVSEYVYVTVSGSQTITSPGAQACVEFDPEYLEYDESKSTIGTACSTFTAKAMNQAGHDYVSLAFQSLGSPIELAAGTWYILAFKTLKAGNTTVSIWQKFVYDSSYAEITTTATDTVTFTITEPSTNVPVTGVTLNQTALSLGVGSSSTLTATVAPDNATNKAVTWTTDNAEVATVADGVVTAVAEGTATITATTADGSFTASCTVTVTAAATAEGYTVSMKDSSVTAAKDTVTASSGKVIESVTATVNGTPVTLTTSGGQYVIPGKSITGAVVILVTEKDSGSTETTTNITIEGEGVDSSEVEGGLNQTATVGSPFTFRLNKQSRYSYTVKVGGIEVAPNADGSYTIPGTMITAGGVTITIEKTLTPVAEVTVTNYIQLDSKVMWLITAKAEDKVLAYGEEGTMFWSDQYKAYCWLVISAESEDAVKTAAQAAITEATESADATTVAYDKDVNQTNAVDINDAQLTYDMYQAKAYEDFTNVTMDKFLEADVNGDKTVNTEDAAAIVAVVLGK